jgi:hypothetical protein
MKIHFKLNQLCCYAIANELFPRILASGKMGFSAQFIELAE